MVLRAPPEYSGVRLRHLWEVKLMKRVIAILAMATGAFASSALPAAADITVDPFSTNCEELQKLAAENPVGALLALSGALAGTGTDSSVDTQTDSSAHLQSHFPAVTFILSRDDGSCTVSINPNP
jgi:hypothetical protein